MNELIQRVIERTGLPEDKAAAAVQTVIGFLKEKLPGPVASQLDGVAGGTGAGMTDKIGGVGSSLGGMFGGKDKG